MSAELIASVIIPIYNAENYIENCMQSIIKQTIDIRLIEVLMIDDGSTDNSYTICKNYAEQFTSFRIIRQENQGVSAARNQGIHNANGKYIIYLDSDDTLSPNTIENVTAFFDQHYDEIDIVTYPMDYLKGEKKLPSHYREKIMLESGVYDIEKVWYINLTTMNVVVKNTKQIFFDQNLSFHEDEIYLAHVALQRKKIGFCKEAKYLYYIHEDNTTVTKSNPYFIFESTLSAYEELARCYSAGGEVHPYIQMLILNDFIWKTKQDKLLPYHYDNEKFVLSEERIRTLASVIDDDIIINHPHMDKFHKFYFLQLKGKEKYKLYNGPCGLALCRENKLLFLGEKIEIVLLRFILTEDKLYIMGYLKSPLFSFIEKPELMYSSIDSEGEDTRSIELSDSFWNYYKSKIKTNRFWGFEHEIDLSKKSATFRFKYYVCIRGYEYSTTFYFMQQIPFNNEIRRYVVYKNEYRVNFEKNTFNVNKVTEKQVQQHYKRLSSWYFHHHKKFWAVRKAIKLLRFSSKRIWLYNDCHGVKKDNGYYQFIHDFDKKDGVLRFYIVNDDFSFVLDGFDKVQQKYLVHFGSAIHKLLFLRAEKIISAFIEKENYMPFDWETFAHYEDLTHFELVYLQHGILHAHLPWKYARDRLPQLKEVVSTTYEVRNLKANYGFTDKQLILSGMPRYDYIDAQSKPRKKILFAPSWRKYLIKRQNGNAQWNPVDKIFLESEFYHETFNFLNSKKLHNILANYGYELDFKLHPIFSCYQQHYSEIVNESIHISNNLATLDDYSICITDFSSFYFDFVYIKRSILFFCPDYIKFKAGMSDYRELDIPLEDSFGPLVFNSHSAIQELEAMLKRDGVPAEQYLMKMDNFFLHYDNKQCDRLYEALMKGN